jgi:hypothetical protein
MYFFLLCLAAIGIEIILKKRHELTRILKKYALVILSLLIIPWVSHWVFGTDIDTLWLIGTHEKHHGYIFLVGMVCFGVVLSCLEGKEREKLMEISLLSALIVSLFALLEYANIYSFLGRYSQSWEVGRTIATLGNPNYLAGYLIMHMPVIFSRKKPWEKWGGLLILILAIFSTGSYIAIGLIGIYLVVLILRRVSSVWQRYIFLFLLI